MRAAVGCSDRGHTAVSQLKPGDVDWDALFGEQGARWLHTGGIFAALSETTPLVAKEAMHAARKHGTIVSYDLNYRASLWKSIGGKKRAQEVNRELAAYVDVMLGNEEDFTAALGFEVEGVDENLSGARPRQLPQDDRAGGRELPELQGRRHDAAHRALGIVNDWGAVSTRTASSTSSRAYEDLEILDRVGGGDSFASGLIYGFLAGKGPQWAVECGAAHGALAMTTPGRHHDGDPRRGGARDEGRRGARAALSLEDLRTRPWTRRPSSSDSSDRARPRDPGAVGRRGRRRRSTRSRPGASRSSRSR